MVIFLLLLRSPRSAGPVLQAYRVLLVSLLLLHQVTRYELLEHYKCLFEEFLAALLSWILLCPYEHLLCGFLVLVLPLYYFYLVFYIGKVKLVLFTR